MSYSTGNMSSVSRWTIDVLFLLFHDSFRLLQQPIASIALVQLKNILILCACVHVDFYFVAGLCCSKSSLESDRFRRQVLADVRVQPAKVMH